MLVTNKKLGDMLSTPTLEVTVEVVEADGPDGKELALLITQGSNVITIRPKTLTTILAWCL
jgi:hypothetical protein